MKNQLQVAITNNIKEIQKTLPKEIENRMLKSAIELHGHVVKTLSGKRSGRWYKVPNVNKMHQASASGESPAQLFGGLRTGYKFQVMGTGWASVGVVGSPEQYAVWLEKGTSRMSPRPHLRRSLVENYKNIIRHYEDLL